MLIEFRVSNYRSVAEEQVLSMVPAKGQSDYPSNIFTTGKYEVLNSIGLYGPNNSGKTNLLRALDIFDRVVFLSVRSNSTTKLPYDPNLLIEGYAEEPCKMEITFIIEGTRYRYGFEFNQLHILKEWLHRKKAGREVEVFYREKDVIEVSSAFEGNAKLIDAAIEATRDNALFLSFCDMLNIKEAKVIFSWFRKLVNVDGLSMDSETINTISLFTSKQEYRDRILRQLQGFNLKFLDIEIEDIEIDSSLFPKNLSPGLVEKLSGVKGYQVYSIRQTYKRDGTLRNEKIKWPFDERESQGTNKMFSLSGPVIFALLNGGVLVVDEIEAKLHTKITGQIVDLFLSEKTNPHGAQLIFATHDTNLLKYAKLRRDQIIFVEQNKKEATEIYSLSDFTYFDGNKERPDTDKEKRYLEDRYGATPKLKNWDELTQTVLR
ncbi:MAG: ATP/GTP-binding protein [Bacteroidia bacterium]